jgi:uncharacterized protein (DUF433 family)
MFEKITIDPTVCHGKPIIKGTRVLVSNILSALSSGQTFEEILEDYPNISKEDILEVLAFGSYLTKFENHSYDTKAS